MAKLSKLPAERQLQTYILVMVGLMLAALLVAPFVAVGVQHLFDLEAMDQRKVPMRAVMGILLALAGLRLPLLVSRHAEAIRTVSGMRFQYLMACAVTVFLGALFMLFWFTGLAASLVGLVTVLLVLRQHPVPEAEMTEQIDYRDPENWSKPRIDTRKLVLYGILLAIATPFVAFGVFLLFTD